MNSIKENVMDEVPNEGGLLLSHNDRDVMAFIVDNFLDSARRTQNVLLNYISNSYSLKNFPKSMNDFIKKIEYWEEKIPKNIVQTIHNYWDKSGRQLKDYRDLSQHFAVIASDARAFKDGSGEIHIFFVLPNNPEIKSASKTIYESPYIHVLIYVYMF